MKLFVASNRGVYILSRHEDSWRESGGAYTGHTFTSVAAHDHAVLAGGQGGLFRSADQGQTWWEANQGLSQRHVRWLAYHPDEPDLAFVGTEPAALFVSEDGGQSWRECPEVAQLRDEYDWYLPYSPEAGCVRGLAFHGYRGYAAVEQGGLLRSDNRGQSWDLAPGSTGDPRAEIPDGFIHPDVHSVVVHPSSRDLVFAPTGGGFYRSTDGGQSWTHLYRSYCRAAWVDPADVGHLVLGPADSVDANGRVEESIDAGENWQPVMDGLDPVWPKHMVQRFVQAGDELVAVLSNGEVIAAPLSNLNWRQVLPPVQGAQAAAFITE